MSAINTKMSSSRNNLMAITTDIEIRKLKSLSPSHFTKLVQLLDENDSWRILMSIVPKVLPLPSDANTLQDERRSWEKLYNSTHIKLIENASKKDTRTPAEIFLFEWATTGRKRATLVHLLQLLKAANLYRAADYVAMEILRQGAIERPTTGPAAKINLFELDEELEEDVNENPQVSNVTLEQNLDNSKPENTLRGANAPKLLVPNEPRGRRTLEPTQANNTGFDNSTIRIGQDNIPMLRVTEPTGSVESVITNQSGRDYLGVDSASNCGSDCKVENIVLQSPPDSIISGSRPNLSKLMNVPSDYIISRSTSNSTIDSSGSLSSKDALPTNTYTESETSDNRPNFSELLSAPPSSSVKSCTFGNTSPQKNSELSRENILSDTLETSNNRPNLSTVLTEIAISKQGADKNRRESSGLLNQATTSPKTGEIRPEFSALLNSSDVQSSNLPVFDNLLSEHSRIEELSPTPAFSALPSNMATNDAAEESQTSFNELSSSDEE